MISLKVRLILFISLPELKLCVYWGISLLIIIALDLCASQLDDPHFCALKLDALVETHLHIAPAIEIFELNAAALV